MKSKCTHSFSSVFVSLINASLLVKLLLVSVFISHINAQKFVPFAKKSLCNAGGDGYANNIDDCTKLDPTYNGTWYCSKMTICEKFLPTIGGFQYRGIRKCSVVKGCAYESECINQETGLLYSGEPLTVNICIYICMYICMYIDIYL
jgi:hypothetical protein